MSEGGKMSACDHGIVFDVAAASTETLTQEQVRKRWPRLDGKCPKGCGLQGIAYAGAAHYFAWGKDGR